MANQTTQIEIGRLLRAGTSGFVVGCRVSQVEAPSFGALVSVPQDNGVDIFGLIYDIHIDDDGLVRQLVTAEGVQESVIADNRVNRNVPLEISVLAVGYRQAGTIFHLLPPRPPLSLDQIFLCGNDQICQFTSAGRFGYFRHVLRSKDLPIGELLAAHIQQARQAHQQAGNLAWTDDAARELITLLRDDYSTLMAVLSALRDVITE
jgi:hypothetical protein